MTPTVTEAPGARWATDPFVMGSPVQFARLRDWLTAVGYTEPEICAKAGVETIGDIKTAESGRTVLAEPVDPQSLLVLLFLDSQPIPWSTVRSVLSPDALSTLTDLGLLQPALADPDRCVAAVALFPSEDVFVVSDRLNRPEVIGDGLPSDLVYSPLTRETRQFVRLMPRIPCGNYLEMCAGTGIAALLAARQFARHAYSADITERSTRFARFNAALNGLDNFTAVQGDLYAPVAGTMFDVVTAHPPYVPAETTEMVFRDGGADGEQITRRIVAGLADHLNPGGLFYLDCMMTDRTRDTTEQRIRRMLGPAEEEFDVVVFRSGEVAVNVYLAESLAAGRMTAQAFHRQVEYFNRVGIERLVASTTLIQRRTRPRPVVTRHQILGGDPGAEHLLRLLRYLSSSVDWGPDEIHRLLDSRPRALPNTELAVRSVLRDGAWEATATRIGTSEPFSVASQCPPWFPAMLARCDGRLTARDHLDRLRAEGSVPDTTSDDDFAQLLRELADVPYLELDGFPLSSPPDDQEASPRAVSPGPGPRALDEASATPP